ncbi:MAG: ubiquinol-cytochrome c reductase iron-sulfur subunit [Gammaproteobacteria bacterium]
MSEEEAVSYGRRKLLIGVTAAVGAVGAVGVATPFVRSWNPSAKARAAGAPVEADISQLQPGQKMVVEWQGRPVWIVKRTPEVLEALSSFTEQLKDPDSHKEQQPEYAQNAHRSIRPDILVLLGICTHLGCSPTYRPDVGAADLGGGTWHGGFFCPCHGSKFDLAGRVYKGVPAPVNLEVPPYRFLSDSILVVGEDAEEAA